MMGEYMSLTDAAKYLGFESKHAIYDYIGYGLPVVKVGRSTRVKKTSLDQFMKDHEVVIDRKEQSNGAINN